MADLKWFDDYSGQSTEEMLSLEGEYRTDSLVVAFEQGLAQKAAEVGCEKLTEEERVVLAIEALEREVNNGGYDQFFRNSSDEYASIVVNALARIGCPAIAAVTQDAIDALGIKGSITVAAIDCALAEGDDQRDKKLHECDEKYFREEADLAPPLFEFIKNNKDRVRLPK